MFDNKFKRFVKENIDADVAELLLKKAPENIDIKAAAQQIASRQKAKNKLPDLYGNFDLIFPKSISIEQSSSELTAKYKASLFNYSTFADLTGGFGIDTIHFARNAVSGFYIEKNKEIADIVEHNFKALGINNVEIINDEAENFIEKDKHIDLIYIDPARRSNKGKVFLLEDSLPNVIELFPKLMQIGDKIMIKASPMLDITSAFNSIKEINSIKVVSVDNECKEILLIYDKDNNDDRSVEAVELTTSQYMKFHMENAKIKYSEPLKYIYEPNAALMKSGAQNQNAVENNLYKLHHSTNLFTSNELHKDYFGEKYELIANIKYSAKELINVLPELKANVKTRNFPDNVDLVKKKLKIKDGGDLYLFAITDLNEKKRLLLCKKA